MKKLLLTLIVLFTINICFAQNQKVLEKASNSIETVYEDSKKGISTVYEDLKSTTPQIKTALESLSKELKTTTDLVWLILVKQQLVWSWCFLTLTLSALFNWFLFYKRNLNIKLTKDDFIIGQKDIKELILNDKYSEYSSGDRGKKYFSIDKGKEDIVIPIKNIINNWFKYLHLIICISLSLLSIWHFTDMMTGFLNPEFGALKTIIKVAQTLK